MSDPIVELATGLTPTVAVKLASSLEIDGSLTKALSTLADDSPLTGPLRESYGLLGAAPLASVL